MENKETKKSKYKIKLKNDVYDNNNCAVDNPNIGDVEILVPDTK